MSGDLCAQRERLRQLTRTNPDPRVRRRAHALLLLTEGHAVVAVARLFATVPHRVRAWRSRFLASGRHGLADEPRTGRPPKLDAVALASLEEALEASPQTYGLPVTLWSIRDLREKFAVFGALDYASGQIVWQLSPHKDGKAFVVFLEHLVATLPDGPLVVVLDNVGYHKGRLAKDWWMTHQDRVRPLWQPAYAPELNLMERVWGYVKDKLSCHRWWADSPALENATAHLLSDLQARFHQPDPGGIALVHNFCEAA